MDKVKPPYMLAVAVTMLCGCASVGSEGSSSHSAPIGLKAKATADVEVQPGQFRVAPNIAVSKKLESWVSVTENCDQLTWKLD
jgi:hypothetical protein